MGERNFSHIFDAFGKLTSFKIVPPNKVYFSHKFLRTESYIRSTQLKDIAPYVFISDTVPPLSYFQKISGLLRGADNVDVNVVRYGGPDGQYVAVSDVWKSYEFDLDRLEKIRVVDPPFKGQQMLSKWIPDPSAAHPMKIAGSDDYINYVAEVNPMFWMPNKMSLVRIKSADVRNVITSWFVKRVSYIHSFAMTKKWAIIPEHPMFVNTNQMMKYATLLKTLSWEPDKPTLFRVIDINSGQLITFQANFSVFFMHHINSFDVGKGSIVADFVVYDDFSFIASFKRDILINRTRRNMLDPNSCIVRLTFDLVKHVVTMDKMVPTEGAGMVNRLDMPIINERYRYEPYSFIYGLVFKSDNTELSNITIVKKDLKNSGQDRIWFETNHYPMEPWFIPDPEGSREDDGILLTLVLDGEQRRSYIAVLDAANMTLINKAYLPTPVPMTIHGHLF